MWHGFSHSPDCKVQCKEEGIKRILEVWLFMLSSHENWTQITSWAWLQLTHDHLANKRHWIQKSSDGINHNKSTFLLKSGDCSLKKEIKEMLGNQFWNHSILWWFLFFWKVWPKHNHQQQHEPLTRHNFFLFIITCTRCPKSSLHLVHKWLEDCCGKEVFDPWAFMRTVFSNPCSFTLNQSKNKSQLLKIVAPSCWHCKVQEVLNVCLMPQTRAIHK